MNNKRFGEIIIILTVLSFGLFFISFFAPMDKLQEEDDYHQFTACNHGCGRMIEVIYGTYTNNNEAIIVYNERFFICKELCYKDYIVDKTHKYMKHINETYEKQSFLEENN